MTLLPEPGSKQKFNTISIFLPEPGIIFIYKSDSTTFSATCFCSAHVGTRSGNKSDYKSTVFCCLAKTMADDDHDVYHNSICPNNALVPWRLLVMPRRVEEFHWRQFFVPIYQTWLCKRNNLHDRLDECGNALGKSKIPATEGNSLGFDKITICNSSRPAHKCVTMIQNIFAMYVKLCSHKLCS